MTVAEQAPPIVWSPQKGGQRAFLTCPIGEALFEGPRGNGKTDVLIADYLREVGVGWGAYWVGVILRHTYKQLDEIVLKSRRMIPRMFPGAKFNESRYDWTFPAGEILRFRQMKAADDIQNVQGHELPWIGWDELANWSTPDLFLLTMASQRSSKQGIPKRYRATSNPWGPGLSWVKQRYRLPIAPGHTIGPVITDSVGIDGKLEDPRVAIHGSLEENRVLLEADPEYLGRLRTAASGDEAVFRAWVHGDWSVAVGGRFSKSWDADTHVVEPFDVPRSWRIDRSFDYGLSAPFSVCWWAESDGSDLDLRDGSTISTVRGDLFLIGEWYGWNGKPNQGVGLLNWEIAAGIIEREDARGWSGRVDPGPADSSIYDRTGNGSSIALEMARPVRIDGRRRAGVEWTRADKRPGTRVLRAQLLTDRLENAKKPESGVRERPGVFFFNTCEHAIRTVPVLPRDEKNPDDVDTSAEDHAYDSVGYRIIAAHGSEIRSRITTMR